MYGGKLELGRSGPRRMRAGRRVERTTIYIVGGRSIQRVSIPWGVGAGATQRTCRAYGVLNRGRSVSEGRRVQPSTTAPVDKYLVLFIFCSIEHRMISQSPN